VGSARSLFKISYTKLAGPSPQVPNNNQRFFKLLVEIPDFLRLLHCGYFFRMSCMGLSPPALVRGSRGRGRTH
jgi:hypothetical protein